MKFAASLLLVMVAMLCSGCGGDNPPPPPPPPTVVPTPAPTLLPTPLPTPLPKPYPTPYPTVIPTPVPPPVPQVYIQVTRANTAEICGYVAVASTIAATTVVNVQLESALATPVVTGAVAPAALGTAVPANMDSVSLGIPGVPAGSERSAFRFDLTQAPYAGNAALAPGQPVVVAVPPAVAGGADVARSRVLFLRDVKHIRAHIYEATPQYVHACIAVPRSVAVSTYDVQLLAVAEPTDNVSSAALIAIGASQTITAATTDTPPPWAPQAQPQQPQPGALPQFPPIAGQGAPYPYPYPQAGGGWMKHTYIEARLDNASLAPLAAYLQPGRRVLLMVSSAGFPRAFSRPAVIQPGTTPVPLPTPTPLTPGFDLPFTVLESGRDCRAPNPGAQIARAQAVLDQLRTLMQGQTPATALTVDFNTQSAVAVCMPLQDAQYSPVITAVRSTGSGLEVHYTLQYVGYQAGAPTQVKPCFVLSVPVISDGLPVQVVQDSSTPAPVPPVYSNGGAVQVIPAK